MGKRQSNTHTGLLFLEERKECSRTHTDAHDFFKGPSDTHGNLPPAAPRWGELGRRDRV